MRTLAILFALLVGIGAKPEPAPADAIALRDGGVVRGQVIDTPARGMLAVVVRRAWAQEHLPKLVARWEAVEAPIRKQARSQRLARLNTWKRERVSEAGRDDLIAAWIVAEITQLGREGDEAGAARSRLMVVSIDRRVVQAVSRRPAEVGRLLRLGWRANIDGVEEMTAQELREAVEGRGLDPNGVTPVGLEDLLPAAVEPEDRWLVRRAATEVVNESGLRFIRHQGLVLPEGREGQPPDLGNALGALKGLLGEAEAGTDPLKARLDAAAARGRVGLVLTRLDVAPDFSLVRVESTLLVLKRHEGWKVADSKPATARPEDVRAEAGDDLAADPQVQAVFQVVQGLGLGGIDPELKQRSLKVGAATRRALHQAQEALGADLQAWAFPIGEP